MKIMGLDIATTTGIALYDPAKPLSAIRASTIVLKGKGHENKAAQMGSAMVALIREHEPDFIAIEAPLKNIIQHKKTVQTLQGEQESSTVRPASVILPNQLCGAALAVIGAYGLPWVTIAELTWRKQFLGFARKKGWTRPDYKRACRERCDGLKITVTNDDMADAVGVAFAAPATDIFKMVRNSREAA